MTLDETAYSKADLWWILYKTFYEESPKGDYRKRYYYNKSCAFDIETTSTVINGTKCAFMYVWMLGIDGYCIVGRTWDEFRWCINKVVEFCGLTSKILLPVYVHNLSYEMQFIKDMFEWDYILALDKRKPIYCRATCGIEFRCSYRLSGYNLEKVGEGLRKYKVKKMVGDLDYSKVRHSETPLTKEELGYCVHDVLVVMAYIQECIEEEGSVNNIPSTKTGYVRRYTKRACIGTSKHRNHRYRNMIRYLTLEPEEYLQLRQCFQGGFTHASPIFSNRLIRDVDSYDFTSSYPAVMLSEEFPMSSSELVEISERSEFEHNLENYCCMFDATFYDIESKELFDDYISRSHCRNVSPKCQNNNGRVVKADYLTITITEQDYMIIKRMYSWSKMVISNFRRYKKGYLPTEFVEAIIKLYEDKTQLKGVEGKEVEYMHAKENLNSLYGMTVTDIIRDEILYEGEWISEEPNLEEAIRRYNSSMSRFLFYPWGVWVTAYARVNLWTGIISAGMDYVYSDTDSIKMVNGKTHEDYINRYNQMINDKISDAMEYHNIPNVRTRPKTIEGIEKPIGVWDYEGHYSRFKTLGAKRYMTEEDDKISITVAGLGKKIAREYILNQSSDPFDFFCNDMYIPKGHTGKMIHTYIDTPSHGVVRDYLGNLGEFNELSSLYMEPADYSLSLGREYADFLYSMKEMIL
jgi:hypothetical protein